MTRISALLVPLALITFTLAGRPSWGIAAVVGLLLGIANTLIASRLVVAGIPFLATSGLRLMVLTLAAFAALIVLKAAMAIAFVAGVSLAQFTLSAAAAVEAGRT